MCKYKNIEQILSDLKNSDKWNINSSDIGGYSRYEIYKYEGLLKLDKISYFLFEKDGKTVAILSDGDYDYKNQSAGNMEREDIIKRIIS